MQTALQKSRSGEERAGCRIYIESVYPRWFLTVLNSRKIFVKVKGWATVDARGYVIVMLSAQYLVRDTAGRTDCIYKRGLLRWLSQKNVTTFIIREYKW